MNQLIERVKSAMVGLGAGWLLVLMLVLSVVSLAIMLERAFLYWSLRDDIPALMKDLARLLRSSDIEGARRRLEASPSAEAAVVVAGIVEAELGADSAEEAMSGAGALQRVKLEKRLAFLGTLGNNAPFIGLLGTVNGIVGAFDELGKVKAAAPGAAAVAGAAASAAAPGSGVAPEAVMTNIAEALVATAVGLLVAIPAVAAFNAFQRIVKATLANTDAMSSLVLAHLKADPAALAELATQARAPAKTKNLRKEDEPEAKKGKLEASAAKKDDANEERDD